jgi:WD40 repeat protein
VFRGHLKKPLHAAFSPDGQRFASIGDDQSARIWNVADGRQLLAITDAKLSRDIAVGLGAERALIPVVSGLRLYAINGGKLLAELPVKDGEIPRTLLSPNEKLIVMASSAAGNSSAPAKLWDAASGTQLSALEQASAATCMSMSRDGRHLLIGTRDGVGRLWSFDRSSDPDGQAAATTEELVELRKTQVHRCLTREQRERAFLAPEPPAWCIEMEKWPYHTQAWKDWLRYRRENSNPPLPDTPDWQPWRASASARQGEAAK